MHDLVQHYEEVHPGTDGMPQSLRRSSATLLPPAVASPARGGYGPTSGYITSPLANQTVGNNATHVKMESTQYGGIGQMMRQQQQGRNNSFISSLQPVKDVDSPGAEVDYGEIDGEGDVDLPQHSEFDPAGQQPVTMNPMRNMQNRYMAGSMAGFNSQQPVNNGMLSQGRLYNHNPTVSSVNAPNLTTQPPISSQNDMSMTSPTLFPTDASLNGTGMPHNGYSNMTGDMSLSFLPPDLQNMDYYGQADPNLTVNDPANTLFSPNPNTGFNSTQYAQFLMSNPNRDFAAQQLMTQQMIARGMVQASEEAKPYKCPVIGCEKAYKNQNGLKYHKQVSKSLC
jgi:transcription factor SFP1